MTKTIEVRRLVGAEIQENIEDLARLRIEVFREYPYLYEGDIESDEKYLRIYLNSRNFVFIAAFDEGKIIGASTAIPLLDEVPEVQEPFLKAKWPIDQIFYFGESVLKKQYRGLGVGHRFFDEREKAILAYPGIKWTCFCAVDRPLDHPLKPNDYLLLNSFWQGRGYQQKPELISHFSYKDVGTHQTTSKKMIYWMKEWKRASL